MANLNTATAAQEIWFNSLFHLRDFFTRAATLVQRHPELSGRNPLPGLTAKAQLVYPPVDLNPVHEALIQGEFKRKQRFIFVETRDANVKLLNAALATLQRRGERFELVTVGPVEELSADLPRVTLAENDDWGHIRGMLTAGVFVSTNENCPCDYRGIRALAAGCWPVVPQTGCYPELIPPKIQGYATYDGSPSGLSSRIQDVWHLDLPGDFQEQQSEILHRYDAMSACKVIDERLEQLAVGGVGVK
jgi:hypothetical protein